ncbi:PREDICTED: uncharacterized mitochondrial protein AtMg00810-like [Prunus mume]|uniref:Uncharacterized mitochondrial protein AtMg00810-like n=1 Tax=Prunus mume TaxID=102107 RepID=A0ABM1LJD7_PRUMU|nr:PREDICTED: uncharacterized mitochondrial protein AtMg00810-like [Prunus mume]
MAENFLTMILTSSYKIMTLYIKEKETDEIFPTPETSSAPIPHQSPAEDVIQSNAYQILFLKRDGRIFTALIVYVNDIVVTRNDTGEQLKLQKYLSQEFEMNDLGDLKYFLGSEVAWPTTGIFLSQRKYVLDLLTKTGMLGCKPADTPIKMNHKLCEGMDQKPTDKE